MPKPWVYRGFTGVQQRPAPRAQAIVRWLRFVDPGGRLSGIMPSAAHNRRSPRSVHRCGRAVDWIPSSVEKGNALMEIMAAYPDGGEIQLIIYRQREWGGRDGPVWTKTTRHDHDGHLHIETRAWAA